MGVVKRTNNTYPKKYLPDANPGKKYVGWRQSEVLERRYIAMSLGEKLRNLRLKTKKTLSEQSKLLKVSMNSVYRWEHDLTVPRKAMLKTLADHYAVPLDWLLSEGSAASLVSEVEQNLLGMFRKLPDNSRYKVLGYVERMCVEEFDIDSSY